MFKSMLLIRLKSIGKHLLISAGVLSIGLVFLTLLDVFTGKNIHIMTYLVNFIRGFEISLAIVWFVVLIVLSFRMTRPYLEFGLQNGISRRINFLSNVISLLIGQLVAFAIAYPLFMDSMKMYHLSEIGYDPLFILTFNVFLWMILLGGMQVSSFVILFDKKVWWVLLIVYMIGNWVFEKFISPIIDPLLPSWLNGVLFNFNFELANSKGVMNAKLFHEILYSQTLWTGMISSIIFSLVIAGVCQYFIQTQRISLGLVKRK